MKLDSAALKRKPRRVSSSSSEVPSSVASESPRKKQKTREDPRADSDSDVDTSRPRAKPYVNIPPRKKTYAFSRLRKARASASVASDASDSDPESEAISAMSLSHPDMLKSTSHSSIAPPEEDAATGSIEKDISDEPVSSEHMLYSIADDELSENENLQIIGETDPADLSDANTEGGEPEVPVRMLIDFTVYQSEERNLVPISELIQLQYGVGVIFGASGIVKPWVDDDDDSDGGEDEDEVIDEEEQPDEGSSEEQRVKLSSIIEFDFHHFSRSKKKLDSKIYIRTKHAWYILDMPADNYQPFYTDFWVKHRVLHLVVTSALDRPRITYEEFIKSLKITPTASDAVAIVNRMVGRELNEEDIESDDIKSYVLATLSELREQEGLRFGRVPLIRTLFGDQNAGNSHSRSVSPSKKRTKLNIELDVLSHRNQTVVTPKVGKVAAKLFERILQVAGQSLVENHEADDEEELYRAMQDTRAHNADPESVRWGESSGHDDYYTSIIMDDITYSVGDVVMVMPGEDDNRIRAKNAEKSSAQSINSLGNSMWFCKISYMYEKRGEKLLHVHWFAHGSKTLLQEAAHANSLYLLDSCDDVPVESVFKKCNLRQLGYEEEEPNDETSGLENNFHHALTYIEEHAYFIEKGETEIARALAQCDEHKPCLACGVQAEQEARAAHRPLPGGGFSQHGVDYHSRDFVYLKSIVRDSVYRIGQIQKIKAMERTATVCIFGRYDDVARVSKKDGDVIPLDERRLFKTDIIEHIKSEDIDGPCFVIHSTDSSAIDSWVQHNDHFYFSDIAQTPYEKSLDQLRPFSAAEFKLCQSCNESRVKSLDNAAKLLSKHGSLRGLELFSGAGGLGTGLDMSGFVETKWAVEFSPSAALTYAANHSHTTVYNQCSNLLLQHAIDCYEGKNPEALRSLQRHNTALPPMPGPGDVDIIYGGPPCQSFSKANHCKKANDIRSTLVCNMISYVEFYRPLYFLLENVEGLLNHPLQGQQVGNAFVGGIRSGVVKFIIRALTALGYQVSFKVLQAGQYGAPQNRKRIIFWGAKRGVPLPKHPAPTHCFPKASFLYTLPTGNKIPPATNSRSPKECHQSAPMTSITIGDAICDLPSFDWINPHRACHPTSRDKEEAKARIRKGILAFNAVTGEGDDFPGFHEPVLYAHEPMNRYQKWIRQDVEKVTHHHTRRFGAGIVERVMNIPMRPNSDHKDLPPPLRMNTVKKDGTLTKYKDLYGRMDANGHFRTAMTTVAPNAKGGTLLHPSQKRIVSVRECARAQGFPDNYRFLSANTTLGKIVEDQHRQIGNAVPVPLGLQLGKALGEALLEMWEEEEREHSPEL